MHDKNHFMCIRKFAHNVYTEFFLKLLRNYTYPTQFEYVYHTTETRIKYLANIYLGVEVIGLRFFFCLSF